MTRTMTDPQLIQEIACNFTYQVELVEELARRHGKKYPHLKVGTAPYVVFHLVREQEMHVERVVAASRLSRAAVDAALQALLKMGLIERSGKGIYRGMVEKGN